MMEEFAGGLRLRGPVTQRLLLLLERKKKHQRFRMLVQGSLGLSRGINVKHPRELWSRDGMQNGDPIPHLLNLAITWRGWAPNITFE